MKPLSFSNAIRLVPSTNWGSRIKMKEYCISVTLNPSGWHAKGYLRWNEIRASIIKVGKVPGMGLGIHRAKLSPKATRAPGALDTCPRVGLLGWLCRAGWSCGSLPAQEYSRILWQKFPSLAKKASISPISQFQVTGNWSQELKFNINRGNECVFQHKA